MLPIDGVARPAGSPESLRPDAAVVRPDDALRPDAEPLRPDADALFEALLLDTGVAPPPDADALFASEEPPRSEGGCLREDGGFIGWLGTRRASRILPWPQGVGDPKARKGRRSAAGRRSAGAPLVARRSR